MFKKGKHNKKVFGLAVLVFSILLISGFVAASLDVAYVYGKSSKVDNNVLDVFSDMGLDVDLISEDNLPNYLSDYKFIFVGDERFKKMDDFPIYNYKTVIMNSYYGEEWGLSDSDGVSKLTSNYPLSVKLVDNAVEQVYTKASADGLFIPYFYLADCDSNFQSIARTWAGGGNSFSDIGGVIATAPENTVLSNGKTSGGKICFFGITDSDYWTAEARELFKDCVGYVGTTCEEDEDCGEDDFVGDKFCMGSNVYQNYKEYDCDNSGTVQAKCSDDSEAKLIKSCEYGCADGECLLECYTDLDCNSGEICSENECVDVVCKKDSDCNDFNDYTFDSCLNPGTLDSSCDYKDIVCLIDGDCNDGNIGTLDNCVNPGEVDSYCSHKGIKCFEDNDCDDGDVYTFDECENKGTTDSYCANTQINCVNNNDCGISGFIGSEFCQQDNVFKKYQSSVCNNPGTKNSFCKVDVSSVLINECEDTCVDGSCLEISCYNDLDCDDGNSGTVDDCVNPGTANSYCSYDGIECSSNSECDDSNDYTSDICNNPGTANSYCNYEDIICLQNSDCGVNGFIGGDYCSGDDVFKNYKSFECNNPGSVLSSCSQIVEPQMTEECSDTCVAGNCVDIVCYNDLDCDDGNSGTVDDCVNPGEVDSYCTHGDITCFNDFDCGSNQYVGNSFCQSDDVYRNFKMFTCSEAGTESSSCSNNVFAKLVSSCDYTCSNGLCVRCNYNTDCNDGNSGTEDSCRFAGTVDSYCENEGIMCSDSSDCGSDDYVGEDYCIGKNVYKNYEEFLCSNAGGSDSSCSSDVSPDLIEVCAYGCSNGGCILLTECQDGVDNDGDFLIDAQDPGCWNDPNNPLTYNPKLNDESSATSQCQNQEDDDGDNLIDAQDPGCWNNINNPSSYNPLDNDESNGNIICYEDADCDDSDGYTTDVCVNPGLGSSYCNHDLINCLGDSDCGTAGFMGGRFCLGDNAYQNYKEYECRNPNLINSYCSSLVSFVLVEECADTCVAGNCVDIVCYNNADCNDGDDYTYDSCLNPGNVNSVCSNEPIECLGDSDCGIDGFVGQDYCNGDDVFDFYKEYDCLNAGTVDAVCSDSSLGGLLENCGDDYCEGYLDNYCQGDDVYHSRTCYDKGCSNADCFSSGFNDEELVEVCDYGCAGGECIESTCVDNDLDGYDSCNPGEPGDDNKLIDCNDNNPAVHPNAVEVCNGIDDDCDGLVDEGGVCITECNDGVDNDGDILIDAEDPGCWNDINNPLSYNPSDDDESDSTIVCFEDSDCGTDGFVGDRYCGGDDAYQDYEMFDCLNPGLGSSSCSSDVNEELVEECADTCVAGNCVDIVCYNNADCNDADAYTYDSCLNPGKVNSVCSNEPIECLNDLDCGINGFAGEGYCIGDDVYQNYEEFECVVSLGHQGCCSSHGGICSSPCSGGVGSEYQCCDGTSLSSTCSIFYPSCDDSDVLLNSCSQEVNPQLVEECNYGCAGGECIESTCVDNDLDGYDSCNPGEPGDDGKLIDCNDNNPAVHPNAVEVCNGIDDDCDGLVDEGGVCITECNDGVDNDGDLLIDAQDSGCWDDINNPLSYNPSDDSEDDSTIVCFEDSDCGVDGFIGDRYCGGDDAYQDYEEFDCLNPGLGSSSCSSDIGGELVEVCDYGCAGGECVECDDRVYQTTLTGQNFGGDSDFTRIAINEGLSINRYNHFGNTVNTAQEICSLTEDYYIELGLDKPYPVYVGKTSNRFANCGNDKNNVFGSGNWVSEPACNIGSYLSTVICESFSECVECHDDEDCETGETCVSGRCVGEVKDKVVLSYENDGLGTLLFNEGLGNDKYQHFWDNTQTAEYLCELTNDYYNELGLDNPYPNYVSKTSKNYATCFNDYNWKWEGSWNQYGACELNRYITSVTCEE